MIQLTPLEWRIYSQGIERNDGLRRRSTGALYILVAPFAGLLNWYALFGTARAIVSR